MKASVSRRKSGATARFSSSSVNAMLLLVIVGFLRLVIVSQLQLYRRPTVASPTCLIYTTSWDITMSGFNPYPTYKDSGVEWLGEVPEHWCRVPVKYMALERDSLFLDGDWIESKDISSNGIRYITTGNVGEGRYKEQGLGFISEETFES